MAQVKIFLLNAADSQTLEDQVNQWLRDNGVYADLLMNIVMLAFPGTPNKVLYQVMYDETRLPVPPPK